MAVRRVALSGLGSIAGQHARAFRTTGLRVVAFDPDPAVRRSALAERTVDETVDTFDDLLAREPAALVIAGPDHIHLPQLIAAARAGIPSLVEKPLADDLAAAVAALPLVESTGTPVLMGYVLRHRRALETARRLVLEGAIGTPTSYQVMLGAYTTISAARARFATPTENRLYRDYSHEWDYLRWIFGPIRQVNAVARTTRDVDHVEAPNLVDALLAHDADVVGAVHLDYADPRGTRTLHLAGTRGTIFADIGRGHVTVRAAGDDHDRVHDLAEPPSEPLARQAMHLLAVAARDAVPRSDLRDGVAALVAADALVHSASTRAWTTLAATVDEGDDQARARGTGA